MLVPPRRIATPLVCSVHVAVFAPLMIASLACAPRSSVGSAEAAVTLAGSTSVQPFAERWAEEYPAGNVDVQSGGSTAGIRSAHAGTADIGMSSRSLQPAEAAGLVTTIVARDGIAVILHADNPVRGLSLAQLRSIYDGTIRNWREVGGVDAPITVITREDGSGTRDTFQHVVMGTTGIIRPDALVTAYSGGLRKMVADDRLAIGYVTFSQLDARVHALAIDGILPSERTIAAGTYRLQRPFLFVTRGAPSPAVAAFLAFVRSPKGQAIAREEGLAPATMP